MSNTVKLLPIISSQSLRELEDFFSISFDGCMTMVPGRRAVLNRIVEGGNHHVSSFSHLIEDTHTGVNIESCPKRIKYMIDNGIICDLSQLRIKFIKDDFYKKFSKTLISSMTSNLEYPYGQYEILANKTVILEYKGSQQLLQGDYQSGTIVQGKGADGNSTFGLERLIGNNVFRLQAWRQEGAKTESPYKSSIKVFMILDRLRSGYIDLNTLTWMATVDILIYKHGSLENAKSAYNRISYESNAIFRKTNGIEGIFPDVEDVFLVTSLDNIVVPKYYLEDIPRDVFRMLKMKVNDTYISKPPERPQTTGSKND